MTSASLPPAPPLERPGGREAAPPRAPRATLRVAGRALVTLHLLDLALSCPNTALLAVLVIVAVTLGSLLAQPHAMRPIRLAQAITSDCPPSASAPHRKRR